MTRVKIVLLPRTEASSALWGWIFHQINRLQNRTRHQLPWASVTQHHRNDTKTACKIRSIVKISPFPPPYVFTVWFQKLKRRNEFCLPYFLTVDRKWWGRWRFSRSEAFRVRVWYSLWAMLRHIAWTSWNRIAKKRHTRNILFALNMGDFLSSVSAFPSGSFKSREKWSFVQIRILYHVSHVEQR